MQHRIRDHDHCCCANRAKSHLQEEEIVTVYWEQYEFGKGSSIEQREGFVQVQTTAQFEQGKSTWEHRAEWIKDKKERQSCKSSHRKLFGLLRWWSRDWEIQSSQLEVQQKWWQQDQAHLLEQDNILWKQKIKCIIIQITISLNNAIIAKKTKGRRAKTSQRKAGKRVSLSQRIDKDKLHEGITKIQEQIEIFWPILAQVALQKA